MTKEDLDIQKLICLKQLRLTKWQLVWNKEFELMAIEAIDKPAIEKAELNAQPLEGLQMAKRDMEMRFNKAAYDVEHTKVEIMILDKYIEELEKDASSTA